jgi:hypothetical protein
MRVHRIKGGRDRSNLRGEHHESTASCGGIYFSESSIVISGYASIFYNVDDNLKWRHENAQSTRILQITV